MQESQIGYWAVVVVIASVIAAVMSTTDSALLATSSILTKDVLMPFLGSSEQFALKVSKFISWAVLGLLLLASQIELSLLQLVKIKTSLLAQLCPAFVLGCRCPSLRARVSQTQS